MILEIVTTSVKPEEDHLQGFRGSPDHQEWQRRMHPFYSARSVVEHYPTV